MTLLAMLNEPIGTLYAAGVLPPVAPNMDSLPGGKAVREIINGLAGLMLAACTIAFLYGAGQAAMGSNAGNSHVSADGKRKMLLAPVFAALIIATPTILAKGVELGRNF